MSEDFYNKVAKKFGGYSYGTNNPLYEIVYPKDSPEKDFKEKLLKYSGNDKIALDVGCGDCKFTFEISDSFKKIICIDTSSELLDIAKIKQKEMKIKNVEIRRMDANKTNFDSGFFDLAFSRRGPTPYKEIFRVLKKGGYFIVICIGEKDAIGLKKIFGRGQNYGKWNESILKKFINQAKDQGFKKLFAQNYTYNEYYKSYNDLDLFLQGVPIFEDFDSKKDEIKLTEYIDMYKTKLGIKLQRHRVVFVFQKPKK